MANRYWVAAGTQNWNDTTYWSDTSGGAGGFSVPGSGDDVIFNGGGVGNCTINAAVNINSLNIASGYTGTFDNATNDQSITIAGNATLAAGTVTAGDATWTIGGNFANASTAFTANLSTIVMTGTGVTLTSSNTDDFYNLTIASGATVTNSGNIDVNQGGTCQIDGTLTMNTNTLRMNFGGTSLRVSSTGLLQGTGTLTFLIDTRCTQMDGRITISNMIMESRHATVNNIVPATYESASVLFRNGDTLTRAFELQSGTYIFTGDVQIANTNSGTYNFNCNVNNPNIEFRGNVILSASAGTLNYNKGTGTITLSGTSGTQTINFFDKFIEDLVINSAGATKQFTDGLVADSFLGTAGTIDFNGQSIETNGNFTLTSGSNIISAADAMNGASILVGGDFLAEGSLGDLLELHANASWTLWAVGTANADYVSVQYSDASSGTAIDATNSTDGSNNVNWNFISNNTGNMFLMF